MAAFLDSASSVWRLCCPMMSGRLGGILERAFDLGRIVDRLIGWRRDSVAVRFCFDRSNNGRGSDRLCPCRKEADMDTSLIPWRRETVYYFRQQTAPHMSPAIHIGLFPGKRTYWDIWRFSSGRNPALGASFVTPFISGPSCDHEHRTPPE